MVEGQILGVYGCITCILFLLFQYSLYTKTRLKQKDDVISTKFENSKARKDRERTENHSLIIATVTQNGKSSCQPVTCFSIAEDK